MTESSSPRINFDGVALEYLIEHPNGVMELEQLKRKAMLLSIRLEVDFLDVYDGILGALQRLQTNKEKGLE